MKKIICFSLGIIFSICILEASFLNFFSSKNIDEETSAIVYESEITNTQDIVGTSYSDLSSSLRSDAIEGQTPFDTSSKSLMSGYSITPSTSSSNYYQISNASYGITQFSINSYQSIYMWVYIPDNPYTNYYSLDLAFKNPNGDSISWHFTPSDLYDLLYDSYSNTFGWKFIELSYSDATISDGVNDSTQFFTFYISYEYISDDVLWLLDFSITEYVSNGSLTFYHIYLGDRTSTETKVLLRLNYLYYSLNADFLAELNSLYLNDSYKIKETYEMFDYIYVGKNNLLYSSTQNNRFEWNLAISNSSSNLDIYSGETYKFDTEGSNTFNISLTETRLEMSSSSSKSTTSTILNYNITLYIYDFNFGSFAKSSYDLQSTNSYLLTFTLSDDFTLLGDLEVTSSDESIFIVESITFNEKDNTFSIIVSGQKNGRATLTVSSSGIKDGEETTKSYSVSSTISVTGISNISGWLQSLIILIVAYIIASIVFFIFTFRNIKKNRQAPRR